jgi:hypothetical protein
MEAAFGDVLSGKHLESSDGEHWRTDALAEDLNPAPLREIGKDGD